MLPQETISRILSILSEMNNSEITQKVCNIMADPDKERLKDLNNFVTGTDSNSNNDLVRVGRILQIIEDVGSK